MTEKVGQAEVLAAADQLQELMENAVANVQRYASSSDDLHAMGHLTGQAGTTNVLTAGEIQDACNKVTTRWGLAIDALRQSANQFENTDIENASRIAAVSGGGGLAHT
ncbi:hypothetical protein PDG61_20985 [Mycolicibacterium sp. BiH015]|uniref:hypothetical protein n=1 Tax=Mycolicibacterium sp. BiH015 TaxID=3018808 RepID=UPI0022E52AD9|nr:hypothetical protein [Mycolicibacterium sp. BiH015]MDA2893403.1 hypothetical protein [Mycolicibacterium sp. BiH015]